MTKEQYKNIISMTVNDVKKENVLNSVELTRTIMGNCGVAFPNGSLAEVTSTLATDEYMGWRECSETQATEYANEGIPVIRVDNTGISVIAPDDGNDAELTVNSTATFNSNTSVQASNSDESQYYAYYANTYTGWYNGNNLVSSNGTWKYTTNLNLVANAAYLLCRGKSKLTQSVMIVVFVLREKITLGSLTNGFEETLNGFIRYKSAKETSIFGNEYSGTW